jgi:hypothetical protein
MSIENEGLFDLLRKRKDEQERERHKAPQRKAEWIRELNELYGILKKWLEPGRKEGLLNIADETVELFEDALGGQYQAPALSITTPGGRRIDVRPRGRVIVGAKGRVDLESGPKRALLIRMNPGDWKFALPSETRSGWTTLDLTRELFEETLKDLVS